MRPTSQSTPLKPDAAADGWLRLVPPEQREAAWAHWCETVRRPEPTQITRDLVRPDGSPCQLVVRSAPVIVDGAVLGHVGDGVSTPPNAIAKRRLCAC